MAGTIKLDGTTFLSKSGSTFTQESTTLGSTVTFPAGHVLQVVQLVSTTVDSTTSTTMNDISGYTQDITPSSTSNKILVRMQFVISNEGGITWFNMARTGGASGDGAIYIGGGGSSLQVSGGIKTLGGGSAVSMSSLTYLDSPSATSAVTYKLQWRNHDGNGTSRFNVNCDGTTDSGTNPTTPSSITLMEIRG